MEYHHWRGVISQQSLHTEPVLDDQYSSSEGHILVEFQYEIVKKWLIHSDDEGVFFLRSESHQEVGMTIKTRLDYGATDEDLKQLLLEKLETYELRFDQNCEEKLADKVIKDARKLGSTGQEKSSSLLVNIRKSQFYIKRGRNIWTTKDEFGSCTVCLEEIWKGVEVSTLPCSHGFHSNCITEWLKKSHHCPTCRFEMPIAMN